jgi:hypothetical protein
MARTPAGMANLVHLAEALQCGVIDNAGRMNFPSRHPLNRSFRWQDVDLDIAGDGPKGLRTAILYTCRSRKSHPCDSREEAESAHHPTR